MPVTGYFLLICDIKSANQSEVRNFPNIIEKSIPIKRRRIYGDNDFCSKENGVYLQQNNYKDWIMGEATKSHNL